MVQTLDPFHDLSRRPTGYPDLTNGNSLIQEVSLTQTFVNLEPTDYHVFTLPQLTPREFIQTSVISPVVITDSGPGYGPAGAKLGVLNVVTANPGSPTMPSYDPGSNTWISANVKAVSHFDLTPYLVGNSRLVSCGFEIINTGPELTKSGALVAYRAPQTLTESNVQTMDEVSNQTFAPHPVIRAAMPPSTASSALQLHGSQQWEAYDGTYSVCSLSTVSNPPQRSSYADPMYEPAYIQTGGGSPTAGVVLFPRASARYPDTSQATQMAPWNTSGAFVTGTSVGTVLTVVLKAYIECFPTPDLTQFVTLTAPACAYDPLALELYAKACYILKPATLRSNNPGGEWFRMVKSVVSNVAPRAAGLAGMARQASAAARPLVKEARGAARLIKDARDEKKENKKPSNNFSAQSKGRVVSRPSPRR